jgi:hypothetical protein
MLITLLISLVSIYSLYMMNTVIFVIAGILYSTIKLSKADKYQDSEFKRIQTIFVEGIQIVMHSSIGCFKSVHLQ